MKIRLTAALFALAVPVVARAQTEAVPLDRIVAVVGSEPITFFEVRERLVQKQQQGEIRQIPTDPAALQALERQVLDDMIEEELFVQKAGELKIEVPESDLANTIDEQMRRVRGQFASEAEFRAELARAGLGTPEEYRRFLTEQLRRSELLQRALRKLREDGKIIPANVTEADVQAAFERMRPTLPPRAPSVTFRQIVINPKPSDAARAAARAKADSVLGELRRGADFEALARRESMDPGSRETGGDLGWNRRGVFVPEFDQWLFGPYALRPGQLSPVVETPFGFHIIRVDRVQPAEVKARHILIRPAVDSAQVDKARIEADSVAAEFARGVPFDTLTKRHHDYANKEETSLLTPFPRDSLPASYQAAFAGKNVNDIVTFQIPGPAGVPKYVVAQLLTADPGGERTIADMRELVRERLAQEGGIRRYLETLRRQTYVSVRFDGGPTPAGPGR